MDSLTGDVYIVNGSNFQSHLVIRQDLQTFCPSRILERETKYFSHIAEK